MKLIRRGPATCVFDYAKLRDGSVHFGTAFAAVQCLEWSPYGSAEVTDHINDPMPTEEYLDYALLRLDQAVGQMQPPGSLQRRGWIDLWDTPWDTEPAVVPAKESRVIVIQHPLGAPQVYAARKFIGDNVLHTRMRYEYMTAVGSSGSPCLTEEYKLFALHHLGDSSWNATPVSQGVPIKLIRQRIAKNHAASIPKFDVLADAKQQAPWSGLFRILGQFPEAKAAIRDSLDTIKIITERTADLRRHKAVHDVLQSLQGNFPLLEAALNETDQKRSRDGIRNVGLTMRQMWRSYNTEANELKAAAKTRGLREMEWIDEFSSALSTLIEADQIFDKMKAAQIIRKVLRFQPSELNTKIRDILRDLPVDELLKVFRTIIKAMDLKDVESIVSSGPDLLRAHWEQLRHNVADHNFWQDIDNELSTLEALSIEQEVGQRWFQVGWETAWQKINGNCRAHSTDEWSAEMQRHGAMVTAHITAKQWDSVAEDFAVFRSDMSNRFSQVDKACLSGSEQVIQLGNPLAALVEASL